MRFLCEAIEQCHVTNLFSLSLSLSLSLSHHSGHHIDIIRHGEVVVPDDGSLQLSTNDSDSTDGGSGMMMPLIPMGNPLPTIPSDVSAVSISWHANEMVSKGLELVSI